MVWLVNSLSIPHDKPGLSQKAEYDIFVEVKDSAVISSQPDTKTLVETKIDSTAKVNAGDAA
jgi:hypothetical protein